MAFSKIIRRCIIYFLIPLIISIASLILLNKPIYAGNLQFTRDLNPISIKRDEYGIPTIEGKTFKDTVYGLGFAHAQDRLWPTYFRKLLFSGRLSEALGAPMIDIDKLMRSLSLKRYAEYSLEHLDAETKDVLQTYVDGFNDGIKSMKVLPFEFWACWINLEPLSPVDILTGLKGITFFLTFGYTTEVIYSRLEDLLGPEKVRELLPTEADYFLWSNVTILNDDELKQSGLYKPFNPTEVFRTPDNQQFPEERQPPRSPSVIQIIADDNSNKSNREKNASTRRETNRDAQQFEQPKEGFGSNSWVIHGNYTTTGKPIVANDPHLTNEIPSFWYNAALVFEDNYLTGVSIAGCPSIMIGKTKHVAWGFTANMVDNADFYNVTTRGDLYYYEGHWHPMRKFTEKIYARSKSDPEVITVYETHHGVIIDPYIVSFLGKKGFELFENEKLALAWMGYTNNEPTVTAFCKLHHIETAEQMIENWKDASILYMNLQFATTSGDIGYLLVGKIPIRKTLNRGMKPLDGSLRENDWLGWVPWEDQPRVINPKKGYIVSANNKIATDNVKWGSTFHMFSTSRAARIEEMISEMINSGKKISIEDIKRMQFDVLDVAARQIVPVIVKSAKKAFELGYQPKLITQENINRMLDELATWDYRMEKESVAAAILSVWELLFKHKSLGTVDIAEEPRKTLINESYFENFFFKKVISWDSLDTSLFDEYWCKNKENKNKPHPCLYNLVSALEDTWAYLEKKIGKDFQQWQWQKLHADEYPHSLMSHTALKKFYHRSVPSSGNSRTVKVSVIPKGQLSGTWSPNMRMILSLDQSESSFGVIDTGISGNPQMDHYDDQMKLHHEGKYLKLTEKAPETWKDRLDITFIHKV